MQSKQLSALTFCAATVPSILLLPQAGWLWAGIAATISALLVFFLQRCEIQRTPIWRLSQLVWNLLALGATAELLCSAFPGGTLLLGILLLLLASYAAAKERNVLLRVGAACVFLLIILYSMLLGFSLPKLSVGQFAVNTNVTWSVLPVALTPMLSLQLRDREERVHPLWLCGYVVFTVLAAVVSAGSPDFYTAMKSVSLMHVMQRLEPLVSVALTIGGFCLMGLLCAVNEKLISEQYSNRKNIAMPLNFLAGGAGLWLSNLLGDAFFAIGTAIFWGVLPLLAQSLEKRKKFEKNENNA